MKKVAWGVVSVVALALGGCGSSDRGSDPFGPDPDFAAVQGHFDHPDGTFDPSKANAVFDKASASNTGNPLSSGSTTSSGTTTQSIHPLGGSFLESCTALRSGERSGSCACPDGGSFAWDVAGDGRSSATMRFLLSQCAEGDTSIDGREYMRVQSGQAGQSSMLLVANFTATVKGVSHTVDVEETFGNGKLEMAIRVDDGYVVISYASSGSSGFTYTVRAKNGTYTCDVQNGKGTCTGPNGTTTFGG